YVRISLLFCNTPALPRSSFFPYTPLFRSCAVQGVDERGRQLTASPRLATSRPTPQRSHGQGHREPGQDQPRGQDQPTRNVDRGQDHHGRTTSEHRHQRRGQPTHQQVQGGLGVVDQTRDQVPGTETAEGLGGGQPP